MGIILIQFLIAAGLVIWAGTRLCRVGEELGRVFHWSHHWVGFILIAAATSLPELFTSVIGTTFVMREPDLTLGNLIGSTLFNVLILAFFDLFMGGRVLASAIERRTVQSGFLVIVLLLLVLNGVLFPERGGLFNMGFFTMLLLPAYFAGMWWISKTEGAVQSQEVTSEQSEGGEAGPPLRQFAILTAITFVACLWVSYTADAIAEQTFLSKTSVGALFLALVTSLPEVTVVMTAVRRGWYLLAVGTIYGSNAFNMVLFSLCDIVWPGSLLKGVDQSSITLILVALLLTAIPVTRYLVRFKSPLKSANVESVAVVVIYFVLAGLLLRQ